MTEDCDGL